MWLNVHIVLCRSCISWLSCFLGGSERNLPAHCWSCSGSRWWLADGQDQNIPEGIVPHLYLLPRVKITTQYHVILMEISGHHCCVMESNSKRHNVQVCFRGSGSSALGRRSEIRKECEFWSLSCGPVLWNRKTLSVGRKRGWWDYSLTGHKNRYTSLWGLLEQPDDCIAEIISGRWWLHAVINIYNHT